MKVNDFTKYLLEQVNNHSLYIWGAQGELINRMSLDTIREMETSNDYLASVLSLYAEHLRKGHDMTKARAFDCSGLGCAFLYDEHHIIDHDTTAHGLYNLCKKKVEVKNVREGDMVFKNWDEKRQIWCHVGYVVLIENEIKVIEAKGRSFGVIISSLAGWKAAARPDWWEDSVFCFTRTLRKGCTGEDVQVLQTLLSAKGFSLICDGDFGKKTETALKLYQKANTLIVDGIAGKNTITKLGGRWKA